MRIVSVEVGRIRIPLKTPFKTALRIADSIDDVLVRLTTDEGLTGYGEAPPTAVITGETRSSIHGAVTEFLGPTIMGMELEDLDGLMAKLHGAMVHNTSAKAAVDMAIYDLLSKKSSLPLYQYLGGDRQEIETDITISVDSIDKMVSDSLQAVQDGYRILKVKVGKTKYQAANGGADYDIQRMKAIRAAVGPKIVLRLDANQGWEAEEAIRMIGAMEDAGVDMELVEQPVSAHDFEGLKKVTAAVQTPVLADESVFSLEDARRIIRERAADLINIKLMKTGGIYEALKIARLAEENGVECMMGCMLESKLSVSAGIHLAAAKSIITRSDLDGPGLCRVDPFQGGPVFEGGMIRLTSEPGLGITGVPWEEWQ